MKSRTGGSVRTSNLVYTPKQRRECDQMPNAPGTTTLTNNVQVIAYADRFGGGLRDLSKLLRTELRELFGCVHLLPFYHPIDGADAGFDPIDHTEVDLRLGTWEDIRSISAHTDVMAVLRISHISADSPKFLSYLEEGERSEFSKLFLQFARSVDSDEYAGRLTASYPSGGRTGWLDSRTMSSGTNIFERTFLPTTSFNSLSTRSLAPRS